LTGASDSRYAATSMPGNPGSALSTIRLRTIEQRFLVQDSVAAEIVSWLRQWTVADPRGGGPHADSYRVTTQYFDTRDMDVFWRRRSHGRAKFRIRRYGDEPVAYLERKLRSGRVLAKRRSAAPVDPRHATPPQGGTHWFWRRIALRQLQPVCIISYDRVARHAGVHERFARVTVDTDVRAGVERDVTCQPSAALVPGLAIVEIKCAEMTPAAVKDLIERFALIPAPRSSKYRRAVTLLGLAAAGQPMMEHHE
jgi:hypothetical protein